MTSFPVDHITPEQRLNPKVRSPFVPDPKAYGIIGRALRQLLDAEESAKRFLEGCGYRVDKT